MRAAPFMSRGTWLGRDSRFRWRRRLFALDLLRSFPRRPRLPYEYWFVLEPTVLGSSIPFAGELEVTAELVGAPNPDPIRERSDAPVAIEVPGPGYYQFRVEARGHHPWSGGEYSIGDTCEVIDVRRVRIELVPREGH